jgi:hypothetical protein
MHRKTLLNLVKAREGKMLLLRVVDQRRAFWTLQSCQTVARVMLISFPVGMVSVTSFSEQSFGVVLGKARNCHEIRSS